MTDLGDQSDLFLIFAANEDRDGWGNRGSRRDNTSDRGATGGRGGPGGVIRQDRNRANPADSAVAPSGGHGKGSNESGSRQAPPRPLNPPHLPFPF